MVGQESKLPLPKFLKVLTGNGIPVPKAMAVTGKIYKEYNTPSQLSELTDAKLDVAGISDKGDRKLVLSAFRKAGYMYKGNPVTQDDIGKNMATSPSAETPKTSGSQLSTPRGVASPHKRKRGPSSDENEFLPSGSQDGEVGDGNFEFTEILDEDMLHKKSCVINRAPVMMAWAMAVAERLGFKRAEALSIASVYTELNALSKGMSLGMFNEGRGKHVEASSTGTQPYIDLMGRSPLYQMREGQWRALSSGKPVFPNVAFSYITRSFRQTTPHMMGALQLLAASYPPDVLNTKGWSLYADFRPQVDEWGKRSEVKCATVLGLRQNEVASCSNSAKAVSRTVQPGIKIEKAFGSKLPVGMGQLDKPKAKKARVMTLEESEATLDSHDPAFDNIDLHFSAQEG